MGGDQDLGGACDGVTADAGPLVAAVPWAVEVTDPADRRLDDYRHLRDPELRRATESRAYVAESPLVVAHLLASGRPVRSVLVDPPRLARLAPALAARPVPTYVVARYVLAAVVGFDLHRGALAAGERWPLPTARSVLASAQVALVLERVNDHENLGVVLRTAAALGVDGVVLCPECSDPLYRRCLRTSIGHALTVPWARAPLPDLVADLGADGWMTVALVPDPVAPPLRDLRPGPGSRMALLLGAEGPGLRPEVVAAATSAARIPMAAGVDSLNVATAAAIATHHVVEALGRLP